MKNSVENMRNAQERKQTGKKRGNHYGNIITSNFSNGVSVAERRRRLVNGYYDKDKK